MKKDLNSERKLFIPMEPFTRANSKWALITDMASVSRCGPTVLSTRATGGTTSPVEEADSITLTGMSTMVRIFQLFIVLGNWENDKANGYGVYVHANGSKYEGDWRNDKQHGRGHETWQDGSEFHGFYVESKKEGKGVYTWPDGNQYLGEWRDNAISGYGIYLWSDGRVYAGQWLNNMMDG